ncbi:EAL domain-containing protein [Thiomicrorhabdus sp. ZW0627]|uniref:EAL domain-containing protein n=1 Tax=Thiomicrorhabdus sp. ZW0627 TaxID=3039774 RepID=UPI0024368BE3|nr:EAL domain-containing protein [Thiomicrorhabdus sp. ZW0627]MDG6774200.1 EAL domain-containing protein [Thiomicrorhabdus sp. ZW0627]
MPSESLQKFCKDLVESLESDLIQQSSMTHVVHSLHEMQCLFLQEEKWLKKLLLDELTPEDCQALEEVGQTLQKTYQLSLHDVFGLIDMAQETTLTGLEHIEIDKSPEAIIHSIKLAKSHLAHGYFLSSVKEFVSHFKNSDFLCHNQTMTLHKDWLIKLEHFFSHIEEGLTPPQLDHTLCDFAHWLTTLEAKLILHATGDKAFDLQGNILLIHRSVHQEANYVYVYLMQKEYLKALSHFENLSQDFLLLDKYINEAHFNYLADPYHNFIDFVMAESKRQKNLSYYFVIHYGIVEASDIQYKQKKELLNAFTHECMACMHQKGIDFINLERDESLHIVLKENVTPLSSLLEDVLAALQQKFGKSHSEQLYINLFNLSDLPVYETQHFVSMLNKILKDKCHEHICHIERTELVEYQQKVEQDLALLEIIQAHLKNKEFCLFYQPIVEEDGRIKTLEALIRLPLEDKVVAAKDFLNLVESYNLTAQVDELVFELLQADVPSLKGLTEMVNVNIYPQSLASPQIIKKLIDLNATCKQHEIQLLVEITEHDILMHDEVLRELNQSYQIIFAIDDFGTGYSNLSGLVDLASSHTIQVAKLDGKLIQNIENDQGKYRMVEFITNMAASLGLQPVIVEFVDTAEKLETLRKLPSHLLYQGYYFNKAIPLETLIEEYS